MYKVNTNKPTPPLVKELLAETNGERIRSMSDEQMAEAFYILVDGMQTGAIYDLSCLYCDGENGCVGENGDIACTEDMEKACILRWLRQPAKEGG